MKIEVIPTSSFSAQQEKAIAELRAAVYPPEVVATLPGTKYEWAQPDFSILVWDGDELVSRVGVLTREILSNDQPKRIGGIGRVMTHPDKQGHGFAAGALREAENLFAGDLNASFALLFCQPHLMAFYKRFEWRPFQGKVFVQQPSGKVDFSANNAMVLNVKESAPIDGTLDLNGLPW